MRLIVTKSEGGNSFIPEFGSNLRIVQAAREIVPSPYSRHERLNFYRRPPDAEVLLGYCTFTKGKRRRDHPSITWSSREAKHVFAAPGGNGLLADCFLPGDEIRVLLHPSQRQRAVPNFWFLYWLHLAGCWSLNGEKLYH